MTGISHDFLGFLLCTVRIILSPPLAEKNVDQSDLRYFWRKLLS